jgi:hypothetical protein
VRDCPDNSHRCPTCGRSDDSAVPCLVGSVLLIGLGLALVFVGMYFLFALAPRVH